MPRAHIQAIPARRPNAAELALQAIDFNDAGVTQEHADWLAVQETAELELLECRNVARGGRQRRLESYR